MAQYRIFQRVIHPLAGGVLAGREATGTPSAKSIDEQVYDQSTQMYAQQAPAPAQNVNPAAGVMQPEPQQEVVNA